MNRRQFFGATGGCGCNFFFQAGQGGRGQAPLGAEAFENVGTKVRITGIKTFGVTLPVAEQRDRPYTFVKIETNQGVVGWGEGTLEGKAAATIHCIEDFKEFLIGADPMLVEHHWQSMYVHSFYRAGPVIGSAMAAIDQALWDIRGKILNMPVYQMLGGAYDPEGVRGYYHVRASTPVEMREVRAKAKELGVTAIKGGIPGYYEWIETRESIRRAVKSVETLRANLGDEIDIGIDFHAKTSPSVASILCKEMEPLKLMFIEEPCPPENVRAMQRIAARSKVPIATGERLVAAYNCRELIELGIIDILQTDINHVGGITALWKAAALAEISGVRMAPHACEGPIGGMATLHVDAAMPNFMVQEICSGVVAGEKEKIWQEWFGFPAMRMVNGKFPLPTKPGLGFELREQDVAKFKFAGTRAMARVFHADGSVAAW
ncbi:galactonate dehydratase [Bryobacterales bacterium F-183]|nr:galactonate dehydratase [Bryobacterales bacterium F-183]